MPDAGTEQWLPDGWTLERVRAVAQSPTATWGDRSAPTSWEGESDLVETTTVLAFDDYVIVLEREGTWAMGDLRDGGITLWGDYGSDLERALRGL